MLYYKRKKKNKKNEKKNHANMAPVKMKGNEVQIQNCSTRTLIRGNGTIICFVLRHKNGIKIRKREDKDMVALARDSTSN